MKDLLINSISDTENFSSIEEKNNLYHAFINQVRNFVEPQEFDKYSKLFKKLQSKYHPNSIFPSNLTSQIKDLTDHLRPLFIAREGVNTLNLYAKLGGDLNKITKNLKFFYERGKYLKKLCDESKIK